MSASPTSANSEPHRALASAKVPSAVARWRSTGMHPMRRRMALARIGREEGGGGVGRTLLLWSPKGPRRRRAEKF